MNSFNYTALVALFAFSPLVSEAAITLNVDVEGIRGGDGLKPSALTTRVFIVASTDDNNFMDPVSSDGSFAVGGFIGGGGNDDVVITEISLVDLGATVGNQVALNNLDTPAGVSTGDPIGIMWFVASPGVGPSPGLNAYGSFDTGVLYPPTAGGAASISLLTTDAVNLGPGLVDPSTVRASLTVIPEPSSSLLGLLSAVWFLFRRRR